MLESTEVSYQSKKHKTDINVTLPVHLSMLPVFSGVRVAHFLLLLCMYDFSYFMFFVVYVCFPCLAFVPGLHSFDYRYNLGSLDYSFSYFVTGCSICKFILCFSCQKNDSSVGYSNVHF